MNRSLFFVLFFSSLILPLTADHHGKKPVYELRTYYAHEGKLDALNSRFRDHTCALFTKHGMKNVGYWVPVDNKDNKLIYVLSYPSREARDKAWKGFLNDPDWKKAYKASIKDGKLVAKITQQFFTATDYSPALKIAANKPARLFELRTYTTREGKLKNINARFRDHTCALFTKHGMTNILYGDLMKGEKGADNTLTYFIAHKDEKTRKASFDGFRKDPAWQAARKASVVDGPILVEKGVQSILLKAVDYSPLK